MSSEPACLHRRHVHAAPTAAPRCRRGLTRSLASLLLASTLLGPATGCRPSAPKPSPESSPEPRLDFAHWMTVGKNYYDRGEAERAIEPFRQAVALDGSSFEAELNLANAYLLADNPTNALPHTERALALDSNLAAAYYVAGCAYMRLGDAENALKNFQQSKDLGPSVGATTFQLARAHQQLGHWEEAISALQELVGFEPNHPTAWYTLSQCLVRLGLQDEATQALERHRAILAQKPGMMDIAKLERCVHTEARAPLVLEQPDPEGIPVRFADVTQQALPNARDYQTPIGFIDFNGDGRNSLFVGQSGGFRLLVNSNGLFAPQGALIPGSPNATYRRCLIADLQNDRFPDVLVLGDQEVKAFRFATNAQITDVSQFSRLNKVPAADAALVDLDFTGKLDLLAVNASNHTVQLLRNLGSMYFTDSTATSGIPATLTGALQIAVEDWDNDDQLDLVVARSNEPPALLLKPRGAPLLLTNSPADWSPGHAIAFGDFNNDLRGDLVIAAASNLEIHFNNTAQSARIPLPGNGVRELFPLDYDNDGWLDLIVLGEGLRVFRNTGTDGFRETTARLGLDSFAASTVESISAADMDVDGDTDLVVHVQDQGLKVLRNEGGNANLQVKVQLFGNRSNASGLGTRVEITAGQLRVGHRVNRLPVEIGVGQHRKLESLNARWLNLNLNNVDVDVDPHTSLPLWELTLPEGSCPYLYAWDGTRFRFVTDLLGAAPLGLRVAANHFVEADPDEFVYLGTPEDLQPREGAYHLRITEELREVLYLDTAELVAVDHPKGTEVYTTGKMVPGRPFPPHAIVTLEPAQTLLHAERNDGLDLTDALRNVDQLMASPVSLRIPQLRGLAEPWSITLDFGPLASDQPLALGITAWLRFGGGMANVAASQHPELPFPFPSLEAETRPDHWEPVDLVFGTPAGKTKHLIVDLSGKLPPGSRRLRIQTAYEMHWDRIALLKKADASSTRITRLQPDSADLRYRGFSEFADTPWTQPLTPDYQKPQLNPAWRITPSGWCTRYGDVQELILHRDNALALLNGGDEVALEFRADRLPSPAAHTQRSFFLYSCGWDKDSDFHCEKGWQVGPLPWHGMTDALYGQQTRPALANDAWMEAYNTRWVGPWILRRPEPTRP